MRYFSANEILVSLITAIFFGIAGGGLYKSAASVTSGVRSVLSTFCSVWKSSSIFDFKKENTGQNIKKLNIRQNIFDFLFFIFFGILYIILCYLTLDGVFRIYQLIFVTASFFVSKNTLGAFFKRIITYIFKILVTHLFILLYILTFPIKKILKIAANLMRVPIERFAYRLKKFRSDRFRCKKFREAAAFLKKKPDFH